MEHEFWHTRWSDGRTGWQQKRVNTRLQRYWPDMEIASGGSVFVPLCGDSIDMLWLLEQGYQVIGCELSEQAVKRFFQDHNIDATVSAKNNFQVFQGRYHGQNIRLLCGDLFALNMDSVGRIDAAYDRAATVALPWDMRSRYATHMASLMPVHATSLLISMVYDQQKMNGPPFSVTDAEIHQLYDSTFSVDRIGGAEGPEILGNLAERGLETLVENVYRLIRRDMSA